MLGASAHLRSHFALPVLIGILISPVHTEAQETSPSKLAAKLVEVCRKHDIPALAAAAVNRDGIVESACSGVRKRGTDEKVQMSDLFPIGSNTKSITSTLAAVLVEAGKINWDTTIADVWPKATQEQLHLDLRKVTLEELLSHQSGLPTNFEGRTWDSFFLERESPILERRRMVKMVLPKGLASSRGDFVYSNLGYVIAGSMLEMRANESFEELVDKYVFTPLKMESAKFHSYEESSKLQEPFLWSHNVKGKPVDPRVPGAENPSAYAPAGTVHVAIEDFAKYVSWHLRREPAPVLRTQKAFDHLQTPLVKCNDGSGTEYACGWITFTSGFGPALQHAGSNTNTFSLVWVLPESNVAAVVCTNTGQPQAFDACDEVVAHLLTRHANRR